MGFSVLFKVSIQSYRRGEIIRVPSSSFTSHYSWTSESFCFHVLGSLISLHVAKLNLRPLLHSRRRVFYFLQATGFISCSQIKNAVKFGLSFLLVRPSSKLPITCSRKLDFKDIFCVGWSNLIWCKVLAWIWNVISLIGTVWDLLSFSKWGKNSMM